MIEFEEEFNNCLHFGFIPNEPQNKIIEHFKDWQPPKPLVVVPKFVADWFEDNKENLEDATWEYIRDWSGQRVDAFYNWFNEDDRPIETLIRMGLEGYTVEKEQLYEVVFYVDEEDDRCLLMKTGKTISFEYESQNEGRYQQQFTEAEIKAIDKRYWAFRKEVGI